MIDKIHHQNRTIGIDVRLNDSPPNFKEIFRDALSHFYSKYFTHQFPEEFDDRYERPPISFTPLNLGEQFDFFVDGEFQKKFSGGKTVYSLRVKGAFTVNNDVRTRTDKLIGFVNLAEKDDRWYNLLFQIGENGVDQAMFKASRKRSLNHRDRFENYLKMSVNSSIYAGRMIMNDIRQPQFTYGVKNYPAHRAHLLRKLLRKRSSVGYPLIVADDSIIVVRSIDDVTEHTPA